MLIGGMPHPSGVPEPAFWMRQVRVGANTALGNQPIAVPGLVWTPKAARFITNEQVYGAGGVATIIAGSVGNADGTRQNCIGHRITDTVSYTNRVALIRNYFQAAFVSFGTGGCTINVTENVVPGAYSITVLLFGGTAFSARTDVVSLATQNNTVSPSLGFQMNAMFANVSPGTWPGSGTIGFHSEGLASFDGSTIRAGSKVYRHDVSGPQVRALVRSNSVADFVSGRYVELTAVGSTTVSLTSRGNDLSSFGLAYLAMNFGGAAAAWAGVLDSPTTTGDKDFTGPSFTPQLVYSVPTTETALATEFDDGRGGGFGISTVTPTNSFMNFWRKRDAAAGEAAFAKNVAIDLNDHIGNNYHDATYASMLSNGARYNFTAANATVRKWPFLFIG